MQNFESFGLSDQLLSSLNKIGFTTPTLIQAKSIPHALEGKDILGSAQTGTGKTGAFTIPVISHLQKDDSSIALILTPTRELAVQVIDQVQKIIGQNKSFKTALLIGGEPMPKQLAQLRTRPRIVVGTPGRINDHLTRKTLKLDNAKYLVLDETDRMLDMGFGIQIDEIVSHLPSERQTLLFSATLPSNILKVAERYQNNPVRISTGPTTNPAEKIKQETIEVSEGNKYDKLLDQLNERDGSIIVFVKTKYSAEKMAQKLSTLNHAAGAIHGDLRQRQRDKAIKLFRNKTHRIMVATDIAARGLDIPHIEHVINYDLPQCPEDYIHRIGRTARAGAEGNAINLVSPQDKKKWTLICKMLGGVESKERPNTSNFAKKKSFGKKFGSGSSRFSSNGDKFSSNGNKFGDERFTGENKFGAGRKFGKPGNKFGGGEKFGKSADKFGGGAKFGKGADKFGSSKRGDSFKKGPSKFGFKKPAKFA